MDIHIGAGVGASWPEQPAHRRVVAALPLPNHEKQAHHHLCRETVPHDGSSSSDYRRPATQAERVVSHRLGDWVYVCSPTERERPSTDSTSSRKSNIRACSASAS